MHLFVKDAVGNRQRVFSLDVALATTTKISPKCWVEGGVGVHVRQQRTEADVTFDLLVSLFWNNVRQRRG